MTDWHWYTPDSYWKQPVQSWPLDEHSDYYISEWKAMSSNQKVHLVDDDFAWRYYEGTISDPYMDVTVGGTHYVFRCPKDAVPSKGDSEITVVDLEDDLMFEFGGVTSWSTATGKGKAAFRARSKLLSNGLDGKAGGPSWNTGHRGLSCMTFGFLGDEVAAGVVSHMVKLTIPATGKSPYTSSAHVWPYVGDEGDNSNIPEGLRVRLKASVQPRIDAMTNPAAKVMAQSFLTYGSMVSDQGGNGINVKLSEPFDWQSLGIDANSLAMFQVGDFEFCQAGFKPG